MAEPYSVLSIRNRAGRLVQHFEPMKAFPLSLCHRQVLGYVTKVGRTMDTLDIRPFKIHIPDIDVADLSERIKRPDRHARSLELIKIFDEIFAGKDLAEWRQILDGNGLVFGILDDIPNDRQMIENEVLVSFHELPLISRPGGGDAGSRYVWRQRYRAVEGVL